MSTKKVLRLLIIDDDSVDRMRIKRMLHGSTALGEFSLDEALDKATGLEKIASKKYDLILLDYHLPDGDGIGLIQELSASDSMAPPVIMQTVFDDDEASVNAVEIGAQDYLVKGKFNGSELTRSIRHSLERHKLLMQKEQLLSEIRHLKSLIPICAKCKKIRDDTGYWSAVEEYLKVHANIFFTHGLCPDCSQETIDELNEYKARRKES